MKIGTLIRIDGHRLGIIKAYYPEYENSNGYPWRVYMLDKDWCVEYFKTNQMEVISV
jgi:hypothetical protein